MSQKNARTDPDLLRERARSLFVSRAAIDETLGWSTPRQVDAMDRMPATELADRENAKRAGLLRQARFPVPEGLDGHDFVNVRPPDEFGYVPLDIDGARLLYRIIAGSYERRGIIFTTNIESGEWGTIFADDKLAAAIQSIASSTTDGSSSSPGRADAS